MTEKSFQDQIAGNHCWGCGPDNEKGLRIKSHWDGEESVCIWTPGPEHTAGPEHVLNGGIIASLIDCHAVCTAVAAAYRAESREIGTGAFILYATGGLNVRYKAPTPIDKPVTVRARITEMTEKKTVLEVSLASEGQETATGEVVTVRVPAEWLES